jgi:hypothetical protein
MPTERLLVTPTTSPSCCESRPACTTPAPDRETVSRYTEGTKKSQRDVPRTNASNGRCCTRALGASRAMMANPHSPRSSARVTAFTPIQMSVLDFPVFISL